MQITIGEYFKTCRTSSDKESGAGFGFDRRRRGAGRRRGTIGLIRLLGNLLYNVSRRDPLAFGSALVVMTAAALAACFVPAWRATRTDPGRVLRD